MRVNGREKLQDFISRHAQAKSPIQAWLREVEQANWQGTQDIKNKYRSASFLSGNRVVFNLGGNKFRLLVVVAYVNGVVLVKQVGTHAEYNKWKL